MSKHQETGRDGLSEQQTQNLAATSRSPARTARDARADGDREAAEPAFEGALPSNTAPYNSNAPYFQPLRWGVDSLYLSYPGELSRDADKQLRALKELARSAEAGDVSRAQLVLGVHIFMVKEKGASLFPYILEDGAFRIQLSRPGGKAPMAYVKVSAKFLAFVGPIEAEKRLYELLSQLGELKESANVSRIDLYADFASTENMEAWGREAWVTRAACINAYAVGGHFSGWSIGLGGFMSARLYNKRLEIVTSGKDWIIPLWQKAGWDESTPIWRLEFEIKRDVLKQKGLSKLAEVLHHLDGLWRYATTEWLRLTRPNPDDDTRSRWPTHPLWLMLSSIDWQSRGGPLLKRFHGTRSPKDDRLYQMAYSAMLSFLAKHDLHFQTEYEFFKGIERFLEGAYAYHEQQAHYQGIPFIELMREKLAIKRRIYGSALNDPSLEQQRKAKELAEQAKAYRKESDGR